MIKEFFVENKLGLMISPFIILFGSMIIFNKQNSPNPDWSLFLMAFPFVLVFFIFLSFGFYFFLNIGSKK